GSLSRAEPHIDPIPPAINLVVFVLQPLSRAISKKAKSEESTRPKFKFLELKSFESLIATLNEYFQFSKLCAAADHLALLVEIVDQLGDPPFGRFHRYDTSTAPFHCRFDPFFQGLAHWSKRLGLDLHATHRMGSTILISSFLCYFSFLCSFLLTSVHAFPPTPNT
ncbi:hypothetical protein H5410_031162, partial [Solanum commersonii]